MNSPFLSSPDVYYDLPYTSGYYPPEESPLPSYASGSAFRRTHPSYASRFDEPEYPSNLYDFNDLNHTFRGLEGSAADSWDRGDVLWDDREQSYNVFGLSDSLFLDPQDCEGMSVFNAVKGVHAPQPPPQMRDQIARDSSVSPFVRDAQPVDVSPMGPRDMASSMGPRDLTSLNQRDFASSMNPHDLSSSMNPHDLSSSMNPHDLTSSMNPHDLTSSMNPHDLSSSINPQTLASPINSHTSHKELSEPSKPRKRDSLESLPDQRPEPSEMIAPPLALAQLWRAPVYRRIWESFSPAKVRGLLLPHETANEAAIIRRRIDASIQEKKVCHIDAARSIFVELAVEYGSSIQVWMEFCRLEMECGEYGNARVVLETASSLHPHSELLLQKRLRVEERLRSVENVADLVSELRAMDTQKSMKIMVEGLGILAKLGYEKTAFEYAKAIAPTSKYFTGNLYLARMLAEQRAGSWEELRRMAVEALDLFPKYGPLWFFCFEVFQHDTLLHWDMRAMSDMLHREVFDRFMQVAPAQLTPDILWKVYLVRIDDWYRTCMYMRSVTFYNVFILSPLHRSPRASTSLSAARSPVSRRPSCRSCTV